MKKHLLMVKETREAEVEVTLMTIKTHANRKGTYITKQCGTSPYVENVHFIPDLLVSISCATQLIPFTMCRESCPQNCIFWLVNVSFLTDLLS